MFSFLKIIKPEVGVWGRFGKRPNLPNFLEHFLKQISGRNMFNKNNLDLHGGCLQGGGWHDLKPLPLR